MPKTPTAPTPSEQPDAGARDPVPADGAVQQAVLAALGRPPGLCGVAVRPLWKNCYRVNVMVGPDTASARVAHSYFVEVGEAGDVRSSAPRITRHYP